MSHATETRLDLLRRGNPALERLDAADLSRPEVIAFQERQKLSKCWATLRTHKWAILLIFSVTSGAVAAWTFLQTPVYRAEGLLEIEKETPHIPTAQDFFTLNSVS